MKRLLIIPSIDIKDGKTVRIVQGIPELNCQEYGSDPVEMARIWRAENAKMLHVVDFDGAIEYSHRNFKIVEEICSSVVIPVEFTGGIRTIDDVKMIMETGISRLGVATMAIQNIEDFIKVFEEYGPEKIVVGLDIIDNEIILRGKRQKTGLNYLEFAKQLADIGVERFIVTDVARNGILGGPNLPICIEIANYTRAKITVSGGVRNKDELMDIQGIMHLGVDSVIIGRALYENRFPCQKLWRVAESGIF
jgi:phosphoribosylformimino-5-aminoimidazole carboxamide ribotide isomerase